MSIYPSSKVLPYVYQCIHKITGKIYIGSRTAKSQKLSSAQDFPNYKTSSNYVKPIFDEFDWHIVAEFFDPHDAYDFEQQLIYEQWQVSKEMSLNHVCYHGKKSWNSIGQIKIHSEEHNKKIGDALRGKKKSKEHSRKVGDANRGRKFSEEHKQNMRKPRSEMGKRNIGNSLKGKLRSEEYKLKMKEVKSVKYNIKTPSGNIEIISIPDLCIKYNLAYSSVTRCFRNNKPYKGFMKIVL